MKYPWWLRPMVAPFLKEMRAMEKHIRGLRTILDAVLQVGVERCLKMTRLIGEGSPRRYTWPWLQKAGWFCAMVGGKCARQKARYWCPDQCSHPTQYCRHPEYRHGCKGSLIPITWFHQTLNGIVNASTLWSCQPIRIHGASPRRSPGGHRGS